MIQVTLTGTDALRAKLKRVGEVLTHQALAQTAVDVERYVEQQASHHNKTGALVQSVYKTRLPDGGWEIGHDLQRAPHALFVHWGTRPHVIRPKGASLDTQRSLFGFNGTQRGRTASGQLKPMPGGRKLVLRFPVGGGFRFAQYVNHPGTKPDKWMERAAALAPKMFEQHVEQLMRKV